MRHKKVCPKCLKRKSLDRFKKRSDGTPGGYCYSCEIGYYREYNAKRYASPEARAAELERTKRKYHEQVKPFRMKRKARLIHLAGGKCQGCGYNRSAAALDFHHRNPQDKKRTISYLLAVNRPWAWQAALEELKVCALLCSNCHREETYPGWELDKLPTGIESELECHLQ